MIGLWTAISGGFVTFFILVAWYTSPTYTPNEPPPIPHTIPFLGHLIPFSKDRRSLFTRYSKRSNYQPFSMYVAGRKHYVFFKPSEYAAVYRNSKTLDIGNFVKLLMIKWFGYSESQAERYKALKSDWDELHTNLLLREENNTPTAVKYFVALEEELLKLDTELESSNTKILIKDGFKLVIDVQGVASTLAYFGKKPFEVNPNILYDLVNFNRYGFWPLLLSAPRLLYPKPYKAKDRLLEAFQGLSDAMDTQDDVSDFIRKRQKLVAEKMSPESQAPDKFNIFFGMNGNSIPNAYCALLELLSIPGLISDVRAELQSVNYAHLAPSEHVSVIPTRVPLLRSIYHESLRIHINAINIREVTAPTTLSTSADGGQTWRLEAGGVVTLAGTLLHGDPALHPEPETFRPRRFMERERGGGGENAAKYTRPFGGGSSYCPGRVFAEKQIVGFLAALVWRFDMRVVTEGFEIPRNSDLEYVAACPPVYLEIRKRTGVEGR